MDLTPNVVQIEKNCIDQLKYDYMPLNDVVREFSGYDNAVSRQSFSHALQFLSYLIPKYNLKVYEGETMTRLDLQVPQLIDKLRSQWDAGLYSQIDYGVWFSLE